MSMKFFRCLGLAHDIEETSLQDSTILTEGSRSALDQNLEQALVHPLPYADALSPSHVK